nr:immunoglobulin light chain junction region [Macaca mulatta]MOW27858.1 immunoglobulin light chain junction region [Macaca mulatta]MOW28900.1 immunoglobulin light chain junction region [Macaca mulatta]MOW29258.1 immunoglobulin light chain junction region [Macaca mulatta]MOW29537.1 immunoglobulin light chain junction region [Macaca mulatta]
DYYCCSYTTSNNWIF